MDLFTNSGHFRREALLALIRGDDLPELARLEAAEHLACCDQCLQAYTELLEAAPLLTPQRSCQKTLWQRIRRRTAQLLLNRCAAAAAAVALALTVLWTTPPDILPDFPPEPDFSLTQELSDTLEEAFSHLDRAFDRLDNRPFTK